MEEVPENEHEGDQVEVLDHQLPQGERQRITTRYMTKYERARVLGTRALQIRSVLTRGGGSPRSSL